ncbi:zinc ABC transporter substrate-binding protein [Aestuariivita boseongensis]|uniref:zinc ABC transporter substrate-binding protein n=1 Tax=Aestuariivita boseongensis TaxID=1470562 RepID=UPI0006826A6E|nr:zinc ABC transporter substrate-binding protein [Aestuariivita boseongensis]
MRLATLFALGFATPALADVPRVATDIPPVHSLAAMVMEGVGTPELILPPGASPHEFSLRPSDARKLQEAEVIFWVGGSLTPWLEEAKDTLAGGATSVALFSVNGTLHLPYRDSAIFGDGHGHDDHGHDDHAHKDDHGHDDHAHKDDHGHDDHGHTHAHAHDHSGEDPHAWLDPENAKIWLAAMADTLSEADPENAATYQANADAAQEKLTALQSELSDKLSAAGEISFVVYHDAYQYFENRFDVATRGAISISDASDPGAARVAAIRDLAQSENIACVFAEPQFNPALINAVFEEADVKTGVLDPLGADLELGATLYPALLSQMADAMAGCGTGD